MPDDLLIEFNFLESEKFVSGQEGSYPGLSQAALLTSLEDYKSIFCHFPLVTSYVELGSGYGVGPLLFSAMNPEALSVGIEFETARFAESTRLQQRLNSLSTQFFLSDLLDCDIPSAELYFLYFPTGLVLDRILKVLGEMTHEFHLVVIESHGDLLPRLLKESWLLEVFEIPLHTPRHYPAAKVFKKIAIKKSSIHDYSFENAYFLIRQTDHSFWLGDSFGLEWHKETSYNLKFPPCTIKESDIVQVMKWEELDLVIKELIILRRQGDGLSLGMIRKIFVRPEIKIELSSGQMVHLNEIISEIRSLKLARG